TLGIHSATITNSQLSSNYGDVLANGTTQYKLNPSTSFNGAGGSSGGSGGTGGSGGSSGGTTGGELLAYYSFNDPANLYKDDSGRGFNLSPVGGSTSAVAGRFGGAMNTNGIRLRAAVDQTFSV